MFTSLEGGNVTGHLQAVLCGPTGVRLKKINQSNRWCLWKNMFNPILFIPLCGESGGKSGVNPDKNIISSASLHLFFRSTSHIHACCSSFFPLIGFCFMADSNHLNMWRTCDFGLISVSLVQRWKRHLNHDPNRAERKEAIKIPAGPLLCCLRCFRAPTLLMDKSIS